MFDMKFRARVLRVFRDSIRDFFRFRQSFIELMSFWVNSGVEAFLHIEDSRLVLWAWFGYFWLWVCKWDLQKKVGVP